MQAKATKSFSMTNSANIVRMETQYFLTSSCLSRIIQRLALKTSSDFEGLLLGVVAKERQAKVRDEGDVDHIKTSILIHKMVLVTGPPLRLNPAYIQAVLDRIPSGLVLSR